ncbi:MAG: DUF6456 domain-containing protein [Rhizomicrobium sp.]
MKRQRKSGAEDTKVEGPAVIGPMHRRDRVLSAAAGAPKGFRRLDGLQWLFEHRAIGAHQLHAGRRLQADWEQSKFEACTRSSFLRVRGGLPGATLSDMALAAGRRVSDALGVLPKELVQLTTLFLLPEDHPFSLERVARLVRQDRHAAALAIRVALSLLARHYGYSTW